jgi:hypothetical protein
LIHNINKFNINKIIIDEQILLDNDYKLYNEYKLIKKKILSNLCEYAKYKNINTITMTNNNRYNAEFKEEGFKINDLKIILKSL